MFSGLGEVLTALGPGGWGIAGVLVLGFLVAFGLGRIVPQATHERELNLYKDLADQRKSEADEWKLAAGRNSELVERMSAQMDIVAKFFSEVDIHPKAKDVHYRLTAQDDDEVAS